MDQNHRQVLYCISCFSCYPKLLELQEILKNTEHLHCSWPSQACHILLMWSLHIELGLPAYLHGPIVLLNALYGNKWEIHITLHFPSLKFQLTLWLHAAHSCMILPIFTMSSFITHIWNFIVPVLVFCATSIILVLKALQVIDSGLLQFLCSWTVKSHSGPLGVQLFNIFD